MTSLGITNEKIVPKKTKTSKKVAIYLLLSLSVILFGTTSYFYYQYRKLFRNPASAQAIAQKEALGLAKDIGKLILLPKDETPTVATVTDMAKLKDQAFFKNAADGNKVLIYPKSKLAIIYDPKANLIINVGPVSFSQQQIQQAQTRIGLRNGTNSVGLTGKVEVEIKKAFPEIQIISKDQSKRVDYEKTVVVVLTDEAKDMATEIAKTLNSQVVTLPEGENKSAEVDILIIVGKDKN